MAGYGYSFWKKTPFLKILLALIAGIIFHWDFQAPLFIYQVLISGGLLLLLCFFFIPLFKRYQLFFLNGLAIFLLFFSTGALLAWHKDIRNNDEWVGRFYKPGDAITVTLNEPLVEKIKSFKANAITGYVLHNDSAIPVKGKIILYLKKDEKLSQLEYGSTILFKKPLQEIKNSGNPGGFNYKRYCLFKEITHQIYLQPEEFEILPGKKTKPLQKFIYTTRNKILEILRKNIRGPKEAGLAEALLIGYKDNLDQNLVQSYTNTGVVHIIAISGLHLGLIYWLLTFLFKPLKRKKKWKWLSGVFVITGIWLFALLAGAQPSVLRSALMFSFIVIGETMNRKTSVYNTLAVSAFVLLCINPYWLWDVGFQLSYAAVISIITFMRPVYNWFYIKNKILDFIWKLNAVTIAAQVLTVPIGIYHFHQFPTLFILTNFIAVPFASVILIGEILLCILSVFPPLAFFTGKIISWLIWFMNTYIERVETIPFSLWDRLQITLLQAFFLLLFATSIAWWLMEKNKKGLKIGISALLLFVLFRSYSFVIANNQQKIIVYNVPQKTAIDLVSGRNYFFIGDSDLLANDFARNFHLKPSRVLYRITMAPTKDQLMKSSNYFSFRNKHILLADKTISFSPTADRPVIDLLVLSKNPSVYMAKLAASLQIKQVVFDGSVPAWKTNYWKKDCDSLHIPWYDVTTKGAFVMNL